MVMFPIRLDHGVHEPVPLRYERWESLVRNGCLQNPPACLPLLRACEFEKLVEFRLLSLAGTLSCGGSDVLSGSWPRRAKLDRIRFMRCDFERDRHGGE